MSNKQKRPRVCVVFFPPYDPKLGRRPHGVLMARTHAESPQQMVLACLQVTPHRELMKARGAGQFFIGLETDYEAERSASEYRKLITWTGSDQCGHYSDFIRIHVAPFCTEKQVA